MTSLLGSGGSPQFDPRLFLDTFEGAYRYVPFRVRHRHPPFFRRVFELLVAPDLTDLIPAVFLQLLYEVPAVHVPSRSLYLDNTHGIHTSPHKNTHVPTLQERLGCAPTRVSRCSVLRCGHPHGLLRTPGASRPRRASPVQPAGALPE